MSSSSDSENKKPKKEFKGTRNLLNQNKELIDLETIDLNKMTIKQILLDTYGGQRTKAQIERDNERAKSSDQKRKAKDFEKKVKNARPSSEPPIPSKRPRLNETTSDVNLEEDLGQVEEDLEQVEEDNFLTEDLITTEKEIKLPPEIKTSDRPNESIKSAPIIPEPADDLLNSGTENSHLIEENPMEEDPFPEDEFGDEEIDLDICAPRTRVVDGKIVIDQQSLLVQVESNTTKETITKVIVSSNKKYNPAAYGRRGKFDKWSDEETQQFYQAVRMTTDFSLIQKLFPTRTRAQIKSKYKKEERDNPRQLDWCYQHPIPLDFELFRTRGGITDEEINRAEKPANDNNNTDSNNASDIKSDEAQLKREASNSAESKIKQDKIIPPPNNDPFEVDDEDDYNTPYDINGQPTTSNTTVKEEVGVVDKPVEEDPFPEEEEDPPKEETKSSVNSIEDAFSFF